ncbi:MAG: DNA repair protein RecO, partial [Bacilli bacterium]|nr:DNA repair protein RecO [Bacilli bacterium]
MATSEKIVLEGIVLRLVRTKEADAMISALGPDGLFSFYARGVGKWTSKNGSGVQTLSHSRFSIVVSTSGSYTLSECKPIESFLPAQPDLPSLSVLNLIAELSAQLLQQGEGSSMYPWLLSCLKAIKGGFDPLSAGLLYFAH